MWRWIAKTYARRTVNINVNIVVASGLAISLTVIPLALARILFGIDETYKSWVMGITFAADWVFDIVIAVGLHWLANHYPKTWVKHEGVAETANAIADSVPPPVPFIKDATILQMQRLCLSPVFYGLAWTLQWVFLHNGVKLELSGIYAYGLSIVVTRVIHTFWLIASEKKRQAQWDAERPQREEARRLAAERLGLNGTNGVMSPEVVLGKAEVAPPP